MRLKTCAAALFLASIAHAQHGASDDRVSLPEGPGSLEGIGDNALINANMGSMQYAVGIEVPAGFPAVTPDLAMAYDSSGPAGVMGIGWDLSVPFVERMTNWGLPEYTLDDDFVAGGQLVHIGDGVYRNRFEKGFSRHTWHDRGDGTQGYWTTELPDGTVQYFGATADGALVDSARVAGRAGATFRYHLVEQVDRFGHAMRFEYRTIDGLPHLDRISYIFTGSDGGPGASVRFEYEDRPDVLTDARSGATERRTQRLTAVNVYSKQVRIWRYMVEYEDEALSNGLSRVQRIHRTGLNDTPHPVALDFEYSKTLGNDNCAADCDQPYLVSMGSIGVNLAAGDATLADMNGDGLPDIVDTSREGAHRIFVNRYAARDQHTFELPIESETGDRAGHQLSSPYVQTLDANGDGRVDLVNVRTGEVLFNLGNGDWSEAGPIGDTGSLPDFGDDFPGGDEEPTHVRFFDYDNDRRIDVIRSTAFETTIYANRGAEGFEVVEADAIQAGFEGGLQLADMNGDGLQDAVFLRPGSLSYRANLGFGRWSAWYDIEDLPFNEAEQQFVELQDINGDSLDDLVIVLGDELRFALNRAGTHFDRPRGIDSVGGQALPVRVDGTTVLFADMNGSGSDDVVWISPQGDVTYLELFPIRPNLLTRLTNGLGLVTEVTYTTMVEERAASVEPWAYTLPFSMIMAKSIDTFDSFNDVHRQQVFDYADAYYDGEEKAYRGFARVAITSPGDATQETGVSIRRYDVGADDRYRNGLLLSSAEFADEGGTLAPLSAVTNEYADCPVAEIPAAGLRWPVRHVCRVATERLDQERAAPEDWARIRREMSFDGYGGRIAERHLGVVDIGGGACAPCDRPAGSYGAPCGATCEGDETYIETTYTRAADRWILGLPTSTRAAATPDSDAATRKEFFYDGEAYVGLPNGEATLGLLSRQRQWIADGVWTNTHRNAYDAHGKVIGTMGPLGAVGEPLHTVEQTWDDENLLLASVTTHLDGYALLTENTYDDIWGQLQDSSALRVVIDGAPSGPDLRTRSVYDDIGHEIERYNPGDPNGRPSVAFEWDFGAPISRLTARMRTAQGAAQADLVSVQCRDGFGRDVAQITASNGRFEVSGHRRVNRNGETVQSHRPYSAATDSCMVETPPTPATLQAFDARRRLVSTVREDADLYGTQTQTLTEFAPRVRHRYLPDDLDPESPHAGTPITQTYDGQGRVVALTLREAGGIEHTYRYEYDVRGQMQRIIDPAGDVRSFVRDGLSRVVEATDPDRGISRRTFDLAGNLTRSEDASGRVFEQRFDAQGRVTARWDAADRDGTLIEYAYDLSSHCPEGECANTANRLVVTRFPTPNGRGERRLSYDVRGRIVARITQIGTLRLAERFEYDNLGRLIAITQPDGTVDRQAFDGIGRLISIDGIADFTWGPGARLDAEQLANGLETTYTHDSLQQKTGTRLTRGGEALIDLRYAHDRTGQLVAVDDLAPAPDAPGRGARFGYDALGRLTSAEMDPGRAGFNERLTYAFDDRLNLASKVSSLGAASRSHVGTLEYDDAHPHAVIAAGARTYAYDDAGLQIDHDGLELRWDAEHRLVEVLRDGVSVGDYWYADTRIISRTAASHRIHVSPSFEIEDGIALTYSMQGRRRVATRESAAIAAQVLGDLAPLDGAGAPTPDGVFAVGDAVVAARADAGEVALDDAVRRASVRSMLRGATRARLLSGEVRTTWAHHDALRQFVLETDADGEIVARHAVDPHGVNRVGATGRGFEGRRSEAVTGLVPMGARLLDPWLGRWVSPDPEFRFASMVEISKAMEANNPYGFVAENPIRFTDPSGRVGEAANELDDRIAIENLSVGNLARGLDADTIVDFAFRNDFNQVLTQIDQVLTRYEARITTELTAARQAQAAVLAEHKLIRESAQITGVPLDPIVANTMQNEALGAQNRVNAAVAARADFRSARANLELSLVQVAKIRRLKDRYSRGTHKAVVQDFIDRQQRQGEARQPAAPAAAQAEVQPGAAPGIAAPAQAQQPQGRQRAAARAAPGGAQPGARGGRRGSIQIIGL